MKKKCLIAVAILFCVMANAQDNKTTKESSKVNFECLYEYQVTNSKGNTDVYSTILLMAGNYACFEDYTAYQTDSVSQVPNISKEEVDKYLLQEMRNDLFFDQTVYQNYPKGRLSVYSVITPDYYTYTENGRPVSWSLEEDTETICGYLCRKATGEYGGRKWTAWYTTDIPASFGPWKMCGLPGLVMAAHDAENIHNFKAIVFRKGTAGLSSPDFPNAISVTREKFVKAKNRFEENPMGNIPAESISEMTVRKDDSGKSSVFINGIRLRMRPNGYVPLEIE